jgi:hypothetical protein
MGETRWRLTLQATGSLKGRGGVSPAYGNVSLALVKYSNEGGPGLDTK